MSDDHLITLYQGELARLDELDPKDVAKAYGDASVPDARTRIVKAQASLEEAIRDRKRELGLPDAEQARPAD